MADKRRVPNWLLAVFCCSAFSAPAAFAQGRLALHGIIIDVPCNIQVGDQRQVLEMGNVPIAQIVRDGESVSVPFAIGLRDCHLNDQSTQASMLRAPQQFHMRFDGIEEGGRFALSGSLSGVALKIQDAQGREVSPGVPTEAALLKAGDVDVHYSLSLVGNGKLLKAGEHRTTVGFQVIYF
ncbi:fimbrial protein [Pseudomonas fontis]|uniref:Type 1 fimbrial protein n=1 Tax=Pseudomonas fontis TaxID=2942633 RepID=A0ABT5NQ57_9PSED|nr:fimbrial protein [Pseudomonas fontis]MDD0972843.1 type 1 fimbrial protein [Pseudomonas fontis]MDD0990300.1 type 1 fimbrial protein [Pseudomonas fontis]